MKKLLLLAFLGAALSACGTTVGDRGLSGAGIGAGIGLIAGPPGAVVGGAIGAVAGAATQPDDVYLGDPVWRQG